MTCARGCSCVIPLVSIMDGEVVVYVDGPPELAARVVDHVLAFADQPARATPVLDGTSIFIRFGVRARPVSAKSLTDCYNVPGRVITPGLQGALKLVFADLAQRFGVRVAGYYHELYYTRHKEYMAAVRLVRDSQVTLLGFEGEVVHEPEKRARRGRGTTK